MSDHQGIRVHTGIDIVPVFRVVRLLDENPAIMDSLFSNREISYCKSKSRKCYEHMAARFAAKEAVFKALSVCPEQRLSWTEVETINELTGRPYVVLHGDTALLAQQSGLISLDISLSHTADLAIAQVVAVSVGVAPCADPVRGTDSVPCASPAHCVSPAHCASPVPCTSPVPCANPDAPTLSEAPTLSLVPALKGKAECAST